MAHTLRPTWLAADSTKLHAFMGARINTKEEMKGKANMMKSLQSPWAQALWLFCFTRCQTSIKVTMTH